MIQKKFLLLLSCGFIFGCGPQAQDNMAKRPEVTGPTDTVVESKSSPPLTPDANKPSSNQEEYIIARHQVGFIKINMPVQNLRQLYLANRLREVAITREGKGNQAYEIRKHPGNAKPVLFVEEKCEPTCRVWRVQVNSTAFKTKEGLGVGSTLGEVKKYYTINFLGLGETEIVAISDKEQLSFMLDVSKLPPTQVPWLTIKNTPDSVRVLGILVF